MTFYNDNDAAICNWLRQLIADKLISPGTVVCRDIRQLSAADLAGFSRVHLFAGIAGWDLALQLARWPASREVWTGSCPCPPFSVAGRQKACPICAATNLVCCPRQTGFFLCCECGHEWMADARHLWPELWRLIAECRPDTIFGEQVSGEDGRLWLAGIRASLEVLGYRVGAADICSPGVGAPHIRQRLYWVAHYTGDGRRQGSQVGRRSVPGSATPEMRHGFTDNSSDERNRLAESTITRPLPGAQQGIHCGQESSGSWDGKSERRSDASRMGKPIREGLEGHAGDGNDRHKPGRKRKDEARPVAEASASGGMDDTTEHGREARPQLQRDDDRMRSGQGRDSSRVGKSDRSGSQSGNQAAATAGHGCSTESAGSRVDAERFAESERNARRTDESRQRSKGREVDGRFGFWSDAIWHECADGKARRISPQPALFPLAPRLPGRVVLLRGAGNSIVPEVAASFIQAFLDTEI